LLLCLMIVSSFSLASIVRVRQTSSAGDGYCVVRDGAGCSGQVFSQPTHEFARSHMTGAQFDGSKFLGTDWAHSFDMTGVDFTKAHFAGATLNYVDLSGANLDHVNFAGARINGLKLNHIGQGHNVNFSGATMDNIELNASRFPRAQFGGVRGTAWRAAENTRFNDANFQYAVLADVVFAGVDLRKASFEEAHISGTSSFRGAKLNQANFRCAVLRDVDFTDAKFEQANFFGADLKGASMGDVEEFLTEASFCETILEDGEVRSSSTVECNRIRNAPGHVVQDFCAPAPAAPALAP
ncbi:MAG: pentapeptide repeat-containing protein, partial [Myxococcaceae bacterium]